MENWFAVLNNHTSHKLADKQEIEDDLNFYLGKHVLACFLNNIYYNICSESLILRAGAPNENIVQNHLNITLLNVF